MFWKEPSSNSRKPREPGTERKNTADDVQTIMNRMNDHPFIQEIVQSHPWSSYTQMISWRTLSTSVWHTAAVDTSILRVDRTFNLGVWFVTLTVFKNTHLLRRSTQCSPIMLGPLFMHWDGTCATCQQRFFSHLRTKVDANIKLRWDSAN